MSEVTVVLEVNEVAVTRAVQAVELTSPGPQGPPGPQGAAGAAGGSVHEHTQSALASTWNVAHNLGRKPHVTILIDNIEVEADVAHADLNNVVVTFPTPQTGTVIVS